jgi:hypothetical protein
MGRVWYATREEVMDAFDVKEAANRFAQVDSAIASASDDIDGWLNRHKHGCAPVLATRYFDWPSQNYSRSWRLWFDENELIDADTITFGGQTLTVDTDIFLEPVNSGPPYTYAEINLNGSKTFDNAGTRQRAGSILGTWGIRDDQKPAGTLATAVNASVTAWDVSDASLVGVGSLVTAGTERVRVTGRSALTTGQTITTDMDELDSDRELTVADGTAVKQGEIITVDTERMKVLAVTGNTILVERAWDGSVLTSHLTGATVYADRRLTVVRAAQGSTGASHSQGDALTVWEVPDLIRDLCRAEAITRLEQEFSAYGARVFSDEAERDASGTEVVSGRGLTDVRKACARRYKRKFRKRAI